MPAHSNKWIFETYREQFAARGIRCEICDERPWMDAHHCLIHGAKRYPQLDVPENLQLVCRRCHETVANGDENRRRFWQMQCQRYGRKHMREWLLRLPMKVKPIYEE
jgi:hypothetical protein